MHNEGQVSSVVNLLNGFLLVASFVAAANAAACVQDHTYGYGYYNFYTIPIPGGLEFVFSVRTIAYARVTLPDSTGSSSGIVITLGDHSNTDTTIVGPDGNIIGSYPSCGVLSDIEFRTFWVKYDSGLVSVGPEGGAAFLNVTVPGVVVETAEFASKMNADWIYDPLGAATAFSTLPAYVTPYIITFPGGGGSGASNHFDFQVKTPSDAVLLLSKNLKPAPVEPVYEILLGGTNDNTEPMFTAIRRLQEGADLYSIQTPDLLDTDNFICFSVDLIRTATTTQIQIRKAGQLPFFTWTDEEAPIDVQYYAVSSNFDIDGDWKFPCGCTE